MRLSLTTNARNGAAERDAELLPMLLDMLWDHALGPCSGTGVEMRFSSHRGSTLLGRPIICARAEGPTRSIPGDRRLDNRVGDIQACGSLFSCMPLAKPAKRGSIARL